MNNQGFSNSTSLEVKAELSNGGRYLLTDRHTTEREWTINNIKFLFPEIDEKKNDNISCFGQVIEIEPCKYNHIMFLGCGEFGNHSEKIEIKYLDGSIETFILEFPTWLMASSNYSDKIAWTGKVARRNKDSVDIYPFPANLFAQIYGLQNPGQIKSIKLPDCPNIHIFAITLGHDN